MSKLKYLQNEIDFHYKSASLDVKHISMMIKVNYTALGVVMSMSFSYLIITNFNRFDIFLIMTVFLLTPWVVNILGYLSIENLKEENCKGFNLNKIEMIELYKKKISNFEQQKEYRKKKINRLKTSTFFFILLSVYFFAWKWHLYYEVMKING